MAYFQATRVWVHEAAENVASVVLDGPDKVNHLDRTFLDEIDQALTKVEAEPRFRMCLVRSKKGASFCHGVAAATWSELQTIDAWRDFAAMGQRVCDRLAGLRMPTVAVVAGACLGGGLELALACDWRVAVEAPHTQLGCPELELGLIPSWGAVGRLLSLVGLERTLQLLLGGKKLSAAAALSWGLVDDVATVNSDEPPSLVQQARKRESRDRLRRTWRQRLLESNAWGRKLILRGAERVLRRRVPDDMPAPWELLETIRITSEYGVAEGNKHASTALARLGTGAACGNLLRLQVMRDSYRSQTPQRRPKHIGILGATPLALHLAAQAAVKGCHVVLREKDELTIGMAALRLVKTLQDDLTRGAITQEQFTSNVNRVRPTVSWKDFDRLELVIDATQGGIEAEQQLLREVEAQVPASAVIVTTQPWRALAGWQPTLRHPQRALGLHFPAPMGRTSLVEIMVPPAVDAEAVRTAEGFAVLLGKVAVVVQEASGGLVQRILLAGFSEALHLLEEGFLPERIEHAMHRFGMIYGPLEHLDWLGLDEFDLSARRLEPVLLEATGDHAIVRTMIERRWLGIKTGIGFYRHSGKAKAANRTLARWLHRNYAGRSAPKSVADQLKNVQQRLVLRMVNEAFRCLDDEVAPSAAQVDWAMTLVGWAPHRGGPCRYAEQTGYGSVVDSLHQLAEANGIRFAPCRSLLSLAEGSGS